MLAIEWIETLKELNSYPSDYRAAIAIGISAQSITKMRSGVTKTFSQKTSLKVAKLLDIDPAIVLVDQERELASDAELREAWDRIAKITLSALSRRQPIHGPKKKLGKYFDRLKAA